MLLLAVLALLSLIAATREESGDSVVVDDDGGPGGEEDEDDDAAAAAAADRVDGEGDTDAELSLRLIFFIRLKFPAEDTSDDERRRLFIIFYLRVCACVDT